MLAVNKPISEAVLDRHIAVLGTTGAGKTSTAKSAIVEPILDAGGRVLMVDATAAWWGLRVTASGKSKGYPIYIFGGDHGDYPLRAKDAGILAETFGTSSDSAIFDLSQMTVSDRTMFFTAFAETLLRKNKGKLHLIIDEAHLYMPQAGAKVGGMVPAMLHAGNNLVSLGRSKGLRITMITQRPAKLHKDSLTQAQALIAMRVIAPQDRAAVGEWIAEQADQTKGKEIMASLASLKAGEAWVWAPLQGVLDRVQFPMPRTFDSSKAPDDHGGDGPVLAPINLDALKGKLATVEAETKANDPRALKAEIARLKAEAKTPQIRVEPDPKAVEDAYQAGMTAGLRAGVRVGWDVAVDKMKGTWESFPNVPREVDEFDIGHALTEAKLPLYSPPAHIRSASSTKSQVNLRTEKPVSSQPVYRKPATDTPMNSAAQKMLAVIDTNPPVKRSWTQIATLAGLKARGGHYNTGKRALVESGLIVESGGVVQIASPGREATAATHDPAALVDMWSRNLSGAAPKILRHIFDNGPATREEIAEALNMQPRGGHWNKSWKELRDNEIVEFDGPIARLSELFL